MKEMSLNLKVIKSDGNLIFTGAPRQYRADCKLGIFKIGAVENPDAPMKKLKLEVIAAKLVSGCFFGYKLTTWGVIIFADEQRVVSSLMLKGESLDNFKEIFNQAAERGILLSAYQINGRFSQRVNSRGDKFFAVEFSLGEKGKFTAEIEKFQEEMSDTVFEELVEIEPKKKEQEALNA